MNCVELVGRMVTDAELKTAQNGIAVTSFRVALRRRRKNADGGYDADFLNCKAFRQSAEYVAKYGGKGALVAVEGEIQTGSYETKDGSKRYTFDIICNNVAVLAKGNAQEPAKPEPEFTEVDDAELPF